MKRIKKTIALFLSIILIITVVLSNQIGVIAANESYLWPIANVYSMSRGYYSGHAGIDITAAGIAGINVRATKSGTIIQSSNSCSHISIGDNRCNCNGGCGNFVKIQHDDGTYSRYLHFQQGSAHALGRVNQGDVIGKVGSSGDSSGYHLHFEIYNTSNVRINPNPTDSRHTYSGSHDVGNISYIYELYSDTEAPVISNVQVTDITATGYTVTCTVTDNVGVASVAFPTWPDENGEWNPVWHAGTISGNTVTFRVDVADHGNIVDTHYATHIYAYDTAGNPGFYDAGFVYVDATPPTVSDFKITKDEEGYMISCKVSDRSGIDRVMFPTWTSLNGQDDLAGADGSWPGLACHRGTVSDGIASFRVNKSDHNNENGLYFTDLYVYDKRNNGVKYDLHAYLTDENTDYGYEPTNIKEYNGHTYILFDKAKTWTAAATYCQSIGGYLASITNQAENDIIYSMVSEYGSTCWLGGNDFESEGTFVWESGEDFSYTNWADGEPNNNHGHQDVMTMTINNGEWDDDTYSSARHAFICEVPKIKDDTAPEISNVNIEMDDTGYTITCDVTDDSGVARVQFPTYTIANGDDDLVGSDGSWKTMTVYNGTIENGKATFRVDISDHNYETGLYTTEIYAYDTYDNESILEMDSVNFIDTMNPHFANIRVSEVTSEGFTLVCDIFDNVGISQVQFVVGMEFETYDAVIDGNSASCFVPFSKHSYKVNCDYMVTPYIVDTSDNVYASVDYTNVYVEYDQPIHTHSYTSSVTKAAICTKAGVKTFTCECGDTYTESIAALGHNLGSWKIQTAATCTVDGTKVKECSRSGCNYSESAVIEATGHAYGGWKIVKEATDLSEGLMERECVNCGEVEQKTIEKEEHIHKYSSEITTEATCTEGGIRTFTCRCGDTYTETLEAMGHVLGNWQIETGATCTEDGFKVKECSRSGCAYRESAVIEATGHAYGGWTVIKEATDMEEGLMERVCANCEEREQKTIDKEAHVHSYALSNTTEASCEVDGAKIFTCTCGESYSEVIPALGHVLSQWKIQTEATCDMDGVKAKTCYRDGCGHTESEIIEATGHKYGEWIILEEPTTTEDGVKERTCENCGNQEFKIIEKLEEQPPVQVNPFKDVKEKDYFYNAVLWAVDNKITSGLSADTFAPNFGCTRAEVVTFLWRAAGRPEPVLEESTFEDVPESAYYSKAVRWATENGITSGYNGQVFGSNDQVTRCQFVTFLWRLENRPEPVSAENEFSDITSNAYYYKAVLWAVENSITAGYYQDLFAPDMSCTRCQVVSFLYRAYR